MVYTNKEETKRYLAKTQKEVRDVNRTKYMNTFSDDSSGDQKQEEKEGKGVGEDKEGYRSMCIQE